MITRVSSRRFLTCLAKAAVSHPSLHRRCLTGCLIFGFGQTQRDADPSLHELLGTLVVGRGSPRWTIVDTTKLLGMKYTV